MESKVDRRHKKIFKWVRELLFPSALAREKSRFSAAVPISLNDMLIDLVDEELVLAPPLHSFGRIRRNTERVQEFYSYMEGTVPKSTKRKHALNVFSLFPETDEGVSEPFNLVPNILLGTARCSLPVTLKRKRRPLLETTTWCGGFAEMRRRTKNASSTRYWTFHFLHLLAEEAIDGQEDR